MNEGDALDVLSVATVTVGALAAAALAIRAPQHRGRFATISAILGFLALDDALGLHERVTESTASALDLSPRGDLLFLLPYLPLLVTLFAFLWRTAREGRDAGRRILLLGVVLLAAGVCLRVLRWLVTTTVGGFPSWMRELGNAALHDAELAAWLAVAIGLAATALLRPGAGPPAPGRACALPRLVRRR